MCACVVLYPVQRLCCGFRAAKRSFFVAEITAVWYKITNNQWDRSVPRGGNRIGAGRKRGSKNVRLAARDEAMRVAGIEPRTFLLQALAHQHKLIQEEIAKDEPNAAVIANAYAIGAEYASRAAPYCHPRLGQLDIRDRSLERVLPTQITMTVADAMEAYMQILNRPGEQVSPPTVIEHDAAEN
jgi:hypothetical protein